MIGSLRKWNVAAAILHWAQAIYMWSLIEGSDFAVTVARFGPLDVQNGQPTGLKPVLETDISIGWIPSEISVGMLVVAFLFVCAISHTLISTVLWNRYRNYISEGKNPYRWYEYSVSASLMIVAIGLLSGVSAFGTLVAMFISVAVMNLCGLIMESVNDVTSDGPVYMRDVNWTPFWVGSLAGLAAWVPIALAIWESNQTFEMFPDFVIYVSIVTFTLFNVFAINQYLQYKQIGWWRDYVFGEKFYIFLSFTAKTALAWWIYFGAEGVDFVAI